MLFSKAIWSLPVVLLGLTLWFSSRATPEVVFKPRPSTELETLLQGAFVAARPAMLQLRSLQVSKDDRFYYSRTGRASGFLISKDGYALTAYHAVEGIDKLEVLTTKQELLPARVVGWDESRDLAMIQVQSPRQLEFLALETEQEAKINDPIVEVGNSGNDFIQPRYGAVQGYLQNEDLLIPTRLMLSNVPIHPGDSGGAVLNFAGQVIGVGIGYTQDATSRVSFLVPLFGLAPWLEQLKKGAKLDLPSAGLRVSQSQEGLEVILVKKGGALEKAGIKLEPHSQTRLLELDGEKVETLRDYHRIIRRKKIGESVQLLLWHKGQELRQTLRIE